MESTWQCRSFLERNSVLSYTLAITSCQRFDLLAATLKSLKLDIAPAEILICEDGPIPENWKEICDCTWMGKPQRTGQVDSCDRLMQAVKTPYVLWCEDDWGFLEPVSAWIMESKKILGSYPLISMVSLRHDDCNGHPLVSDVRYPFKVQQPGWGGGFGGFSFNPGLRRLSDYQKMGTYSSLAGKQVVGCVNEANVSKAYLAANYRIADLGRVVVKHTGHGRTRSRDKF
jgi:hypothetical protein